MPYIGKSPVGGGFHKLDNLTASATATYALTLGSAAYYPETANHLLVSLNGVIQAPQDSFTVSGSNLIFDSALTASDSIDFVVALGDVLDVGSVTDGAITTNKLGNNAVTSAKLDTNIAVTGNLTVDTNTLYVDSTNNRVGVGTASPTASLTVGAASNEGTLRIGDNGTYYGEIKRINASDELRIGHYGGSQNLTFHTVNAERMRIDNSGRVTMPYQTSFRATGNNSTYTTTSPIPFPSVKHNIGSHFSTGTNRFTAPIAGIYALHAHIGFVYSNGSNLWAQVEIRRNGSQVAYSYAQAQAVAHYSPCSVSALVELNANDYIEVLFQGNGTQYYGGSNECQFSGHLVS